MILKDAIKKIIPWTDINENHAIICIILWTGDNQEQKRAAWAKVREIRVEILRIIPSKKKVSHQN